MCIWDLHGGDRFYHLYSYPELQFITSFAVNGRGPEEYISTGGFCMDEQHIYVFDTSRARLSIFRKDSLMQQRISPARKYSQVNPYRFYLPFILSLFQHILHFSLLTYTGIPTSSFSYFSFKLSSNLNIFCKRSPQAVTHGEGRKRAIVKKIVESDIFLKLSLTSTVQ